MLAGAMRNLVLSLALLALAGQAFAQNQQQTAKQHFEVAQKAYDGGDYPKAVQEFLMAYQLAPLNALLFNIGQAYRMSGDKEKALSYYEKYVQFEPAGGQIPEAKQHISELKVAVETANHDRQAKDEEERAKAEAEAKTKADADAKAQADAAARQRADADNAGKGLRTAGWVVGGAGVVAAGVGIGVAAGGSTGAGLGIAGAGVAAIGAGVAMILIGNGQRNDALAKSGKTSMVVPTVAPGFVGAAWAGSF